MLQCGTVVLLDRRAVSQELPRLPKLDPVADADERYFLFDARKLAERLRQQDASLLVQFAGGVPLGRPCP